MTFGGKYAFIFYWSADNEAAKSKGSLRFRAVV